MIEESATDDAILRVHESDNVAVTLRNLRRGENCSAGQSRVTADQDVPFGHKIALRAIAQGEQVRKYGFPIGRASTAIAAGGWVHSHNLATGLEGLESYDYHPAAPEALPARPRRDSFDGYLRSDGRAGTRNEIWIVPAVGCVNRTAQLLADEATRRWGDKCDGIFSFPHESGCSQLGDDHLTTQRILRGLIRHPNAGGALVLSLGCENNCLASFKPVLGEVDPERVKFLVAQDAADELEAGLLLIKELIAVISKDKRQPIDASKLTIGFKCGASDGFSGITANPLCGRISDRAAAVGASAILTEVPEMFGAERLLMDRADCRETFDSVVELIDSFKRYYLEWDQPIYENPSPGNREGGITTLEEKSLGCVQKGGTSPVRGTLEYGEECRRPGLNLLTGPGNDSVSVTNLVASGANLVLFTTGRGNPLGAAAPTIKIASNDALAVRKSAWIDFSAGKLLSGGTFGETAQDLWDLVLDVASGKRTKNEISGYREVAIFKNGVLL